MTRGDYESVCTARRLADGTLWPIPITLAIPEELAQRPKLGSMLALRDPEGVMLAALHVEEVWRPELSTEAETIYGTINQEHPGVAYLLQHTHPYYVGGRLEGIQLPIHHDFRSLRLSPAELRGKFAHLGWPRVLAFQTRNPMHRAHQELTIRAAKAVEAKLLIHPAVGLTRPGDIDHYTRVRCYQAILRHYPQHTASLALLPLAMRMAGPREALWHAIIRKNYGRSPFIIGRDHAGPGNSSSGIPFYEPYAAQELLRKHEEELSVQILPFSTMVYVTDLDTYLPENEVPQGMRILNISRGRHRTELKRSYAPRHRQGFTIFFTGLSGAGKSTIANVLLVKFLEMGGRPVTLLDGDVVRKHLSSELGFSKEHRDLNIRRIGFVASEITKHGGIAICAPIAPYDSVRKEVRAMVEQEGGFVLVHAATPLDICEQRDRKGLYAKARRSDSAV